MFSISVDFPALFGQHQPFAFMELKGKVVNRREIAIADCDMISRQHSRYLAFLVL